MLFPLLLSASLPDYTLLNCSQYDWLIDGVRTSSILSRTEKLDLTYLLIESTEEECFRE